MYFMIIEFFMAIMIDMLIGDPASFKLHPVRIVGHVISFFEKILYRDSFVLGIFFCLLSTAFTVFIVHVLISIAHELEPHLASVFRIFLMWSAIAWRSLKDETAVIKDHLYTHDIAGARYALSMVVGRDTDRLDERGIVNAAVETVGENAIDGIISPIFWLFVGIAAGYPLEVLWMFKCISTQDSMVGYKNERYRHFGTASAKLDDVFNFMPARLGALALYAGDVCRTHTISSDEICGILKDRLAHSSPNSAHGEAVMAWRLGIRLGGPSYYSGVLADKPYIGRALRASVPSDITLAHNIVDGGTALFIIFMTAAYMIFLSAAGLR